MILHKALLVSLALLAEFAIAAPRYTVQSLAPLVPGVPGEHWDAINNSGDMVGYAVGLGLLRYLDGKLDVPGIERAWPAALNNNGDLAANWYDYDSYVGTALYLPSSGPAQLIPPLDASMRLPYISARAVNDSGVVAGISKIACSGEYCVEPFRAVVYENGETRDIGTLGGAQAQAHDINNAGVVVGWSLDEAGKGQAFIFADGVMKRVPLLGGDDVAVAINDAGQVVGYTGTDGPAWLYDNGRVTILGAPMYPVDINKAGMVVGQAYRTIPWVYTDGEIHYLRDLVLDNPYTLMQVRDINDLGQILVLAMAPDTTELSVLLTPVDEPAVSLMMLIGLTGIALSRAALSRTDLLHARRGREVRPRKLFARHLFARQLFARQLFDMASRGCNIAALGCQASVSLLSNPSALASRRLSSTLNFDASRSAR